MRIVLGISGASGVVIGIRLAEVLKELNHNVVAIVTHTALKVADSECISSEWMYKKLKELVAEVYMEDEIEAPLASSSYYIDACVLSPASIKSLGMIVTGIASNLLIRSVLNALRMGKKVVAIIREGPLGPIELRVLYQASKMGITIMPAIIGFYTKPQNLKEIVDFIVGKVLDILGIENNLYRRWPDARRVPIPDPCSILYGSTSS